VDHHQDAKKNLSKVITKKMMIFLKISYSHHVNFVLTISQTSSSTMYQLCSKIPQASILQLRQSPLQTKRTLKNSSFTYGLTSWKFSCTLLRSQVTRSSTTSFTVYMITSRESLSSWFSKASWRKTHRTLRWPNYGKRLGILLALSLLEWKSKCLVCRRVIQLRRRIESCVNLL
jgi:hypothetical protein